MGQVDPAFIQELQHRPNLSFTVDDGIPTIDLSRPSYDDPSLVNEIRHACKEWGFFQVINHGVPAEKRSRIEQVARSFFALPLEDKTKVRRDEKRVLGYYDTEHTKNVRDWKEVFDITAHDPTCVPASYYPEDSEVTWWRNQWPEHPRDMREVCEGYVAEMEKLAFRLMELIALSLGLPGDRLRSFFDEQTTFMRLNHYPACPSPHLALGVGRHKDAGALTILAQDDVGGLEVKRKRDGEWIRVRPTPDAFIINVGDIIQVWSNEEYESVEHRVMVNSERERFSIPFFFNPGHNVVVEPLREVAEEARGRPAKYKGYNWGKFLVTRKRSNFMKLDVENIQIHHFKITSSS